MLKLKQYQEKTLDALRLYCSQAARMPASAAFYAVTEQLTGLGVAYHKIRQMPEVPYVCLRVPTGGGKTFMACYAIPIVSGEFLRSEHPIVLWLVPTDIILEQTLKSLRDRSHPYRQVLDAAFSGRVTVLDLNEALYLQREALDASTCIVVSTLAAFRVEKMEGRRVYEEAGALQHHFTGLEAVLEESLERRLDGSVIHSLANVLRLRKPMVVVDEAHNARTPLSFETLSRFSPSCIVEFTATPQKEHDPERGQFASNVLCHVSASELKHDSMIKLPIQLVTRTSWKEAIGEAVRIRSYLEIGSMQEESATREYIRPLVLIQAQPRRDPSSTTVDIIKECLIQDFGVPPDWIAIATGDHRGIEGVDLFDTSCPLRFIITVYALQEGWDCSFAYVLCSVAELASRTAVEQILGRVMRLPHATNKVRSELNQAYAVATSSSWVQAASTLTDALVACGFERFESSTMVSMPHQKRFPGGPLFARGAAQVPEKPDLGQVSPELRDKVIYVDQEQTIYLLNAMSKSELEELEACFTSEEARLAIIRAHEQLLRSAASDESLAPSEKGNPFAVPYLAVRANGKLDLFEESLLNADWDIDQCEASLGEKDYRPGQAEGATGEIDVTTNGKIEYSFVDHLHEHLALLEDIRDWTVDSLTNWLDRQIPHPDITLVQMTLFIRKMLESLVGGRGISLDVLVRDKYRLRNAIVAKVSTYRSISRQRTYQRLLTGPAVEVDSSFCFHYPSTYPANWYYEGAYRFRRHYYPLVGELQAEGEEYECARLIDTLPNVKHWVRNLERRPLDSFWLQTPSDRFYPDFVALLSDGRLLVVEYKGAHLWDTEDSREKRAIGSLWEERSSGRALFRMVTRGSMEAVLEQASNRLSDWQ